MNRKGKISVIDANSRTARVIFPDEDNIVSAPLKLSNNISVIGDNALLIGDIVVVAYFSDNYSDGVIIAIIK